MTLELTAFAGNNPYVKYIKNGTEWYMKNDGQFTNGCPRLRYCKKSEIPNNVRWGFDPNPCRHYLQSGGLSEETFGHWNGWDAPIEAPRQTQPQAPRHTQEELAAQATRDAQAAWDAQAARDAEAARKEEEINAAHRAKLRQITQETDLKIVNRCQQACDQMAADAAAKHAEDHKHFEKFRKDFNSKVAAQAKTDEQCFNKILCFTGDTPVLKKDEATNQLNPVPIDSIHVGDSVLSCSLSQGGQCAPGRVREVFHNRVEKLVKLSYGGQMVRATENHPFFVANQDAYREAGKLAVGDLFLTSTGENVPLEGKEIETGSFDVFNLDVEENHNYFANGVLVHNCDANEMMASMGNPTFAVGAVAPAAAVGTVFIEGLGELAIGAGAVALLKNQFKNLTLNQNQGDSAASGEAPNQESGQADKQRNGTPGNNQEQNRQFNDATRGLTKDQKRRIHDEISGENYSYKEIKDLVKEMFGK